MLSGREETPKDSEESNEESEEFITERALMHVKQLLAQKTQLEVTLREMKGEVDEQQRILSQLQYRIFHS